MSKKQLDKKRPIIVIAGAGFSGTVTAIRILHQAKMPLTVCVIEKDVSQLYGGLAYSKSRVGWEHMLNIQAGRVSAFREHVNDFVEWANYEAKRETWPALLQTTQFHKSSAVPRRIYQQYLQERLEQAIHDASLGVSFNLIQGELTDLVERKHHVEVFYKTSEYQEEAQRKIKASQVIIATGHGQPLLPTFAEPLNGHPKFTANQYSVEGQEMLYSVDRNGTVFIIGSGLSTFDTLLTLKKCEHRGNIFVYSRHGFTHPTYQSDHTHQILATRRPRFLDKLSLSAAEVVLGFAEEYEFQKAELLRQGVDKALVWERILKAWEPYIAEVAQRMPADEVQKILRSYKSFIVTHRIGTIPEIGLPIADLLKPREEYAPKMRLLTGQVLSMEVVDAQHISIKILDEKSGELVSIEADSVVCNSGLEADYSKVNNPFWKKLIYQRELAQLHQKTGLGVEVTATGELIKPSGDICQRIYAVGPMRQGDELQRHGRTGAFVFSIGTLRNQAFVTGLTALRRAEDEEGLLFYSLNLEESADTLATKNSISKALFQHFTLPSEPDLVSAIDALLEDILNDPYPLDLQTMALAITKPNERRNWLRKIASVEATLIRRLEQETELPSVIIQGIVRGILNELEKIALLRLTDLSVVAPTIPMSTLEQH